MSKDNQLKEQWQQRLQSWRKSGLSQAQWCNQNSVRQGQFWYWKKKLEGTPSSRKKESQAVPGFVPVTLAVEPQAQQAKPVSLSILLPNGIKISDIDHTNLALASQLIGMLQ